MGLGDLGLQVLFRRAVSAAWRERRDVHVAQGERVRRVGGVRATPTPTSARARLGERARPSLRPQASLAVVLHLSTSSSSSITSGVGGVMVMEMVIRPERPASLVSLAQLQVPLAHGQHVFRVRAAQQLVQLPLFHFLVLRGRLCLSLSLSRKRNVVVFVAEPRPIAAPVRGAIACTALCFCTVVRARQYVAGDRAGSHLELTFCGVVLVVCVSRRRLCRRLYQGLAVCLFFFTIFLPPAAPAAANSLSRLQQRHRQLLES